MYFTPHLNEIDYTSSYKDSLFEKQKKKMGIILQIFCFPIN